MIADFDGANAEHSDVWVEFSCKSFMEIYAFI